MKRKERKSGKKKGSNRERDRGSIGRENARGRESGLNTNMSINRKGRPLLTTVTDAETTGEGADLVAVVLVAKTQCPE